MPSPTFFAAFAALLLLLAIAAWEVKRWFSAKLAESYASGVREGSAEGEKVASQALESALAQCGQAEEAVSRAEEGARTVRQALLQAQELLERYRGPNGVQWSLVADRDQWCGNYAEMGRMMGNAQHQMLTFIGQLGELVPADKRPEIPAALRRAHEEFLRYANLVPPKTGVPAAEIPVEEHEAVRALVEQALSAPTIATPSAPRRATVTLSPYVQPWDDQPRVGRKDADSKAQSASKSATSEQAATTLP